MHVQMLLILLDPENTDEFVWAETAYAGGCFEDSFKHGEPYRLIVRNRQAQSTFAMEKKSIALKISN